MTNVLVIGSGGREHAIGWSISQDKEVDEVFYFPGNAGTALDEKCRNFNIDGTKKENFREFADVVEKESIDMIVVGPEQPLVDGIVDFFYKKGFKDIFGPTKSASIIESDKFYSYELMETLGIPQAKSIKCWDRMTAEEAIKELANDKGVVIKAIGLTAGKGVYVCDSKEEALKRLPEHIKKFGYDVLIAERLFGQEFSVFGISDGDRVSPLEISIQDHKPLLDDDKGPNTGGMGAYCPAPVADVNMVRHVAEKMMTPVVQKMKEKGVEYKGFLYAAVIMTEDGPKILEYNCRFGDPEAQPAVMMLKNGLYQPISKALEGKLDEINIEFKPGAACCVVMTSNGYPENYEKGLAVSGLEQVAKMPDVKVFHAGTKEKDGKIVTSGGRVLGVTGYSTVAGNSILSLKYAQCKAYNAIEVIKKATRVLNNKEIFIYRNDIANKGLPINEKR